VTHVLNVTNSILVLDDRASDRELLATLLGCAGYAVREASTGDEALELARSDPPDVLITDILMPGMNGYEVVRRLRGQDETAAIPVVFCTANDVEDEVRRLAADCGVFHFIVKPADPETIAGTVAEVLGSPRSLPGPLVSHEFDREQLSLLNDKLVVKVGELEWASYQRRKLVAQLIDAHEEEHKRIAEDLHDDSVQAVVALRMRLETLVGRAAAQPELASELDGLRGDAVVATARLRRLLDDIQPPQLDTAGMGIALKLFLEQASEESGITCDLDDRTTREPTEPTRTLLYRTAREALANVHKHAAASRVNVQLDEDSHGFLLEVRDDGNGFETEARLHVRPGHLGLPAMRDQVESTGGRLSLESNPGRGTAVRVWLPDALVA
jgi:signal transduction histidine kinase